jgi:trehalose utilization protein
MNSTINVTIWNENIHEQIDEAVQKVYPNGMHNAIADFLSKDPQIKTHTATMDQNEHGLTEKVLKETDVLLWWGHKAHDKVDDKIINRVHKRILEGMGFIPLHSSHDSKIFKKILGTSGSLKWREIGERERLWNVDPSHPITQGIGEYIELPNAEMYGERFDIPTPDNLLFISWFQGGEVFRSGCCWERGYGRIFYFRPGHETYPIFYNPEIQTVITNAVKWACPRMQKPFGCKNVKPIEKVE